MLVTYADDFVVLWWHGAAETLETTRRWMARIGLTLNEAKTRVCHARCESFDFLGYIFGPMYSPRTGGCYHGARPSRTPSDDGCGVVTRLWSAIILSTRNRDRSAEHCPGRPERRTVNNQ